MQLRKNLSVSIPKNLPSVNNSQTGMKANNGSIIMQNWNTKKEIPKELKEYIKLPIFVDKNKLNNSKLNKSNLPPIDQFKYNKREE